MAQEFNENARKAVIRRLPPYLSMKNFEQSLFNYLDNIEYYYFVQGSIQFFLNYYLLI